MTIAYADTTERDALLTDPRSLANDGNAPFVKAVAWVLRIAIACQAVGAALPLVRGLDHSSLNSLLFLDQHMPESTAHTIDLVVGYSMFAVAMFVLVWPIGPVVLLAGVWAGVEAWAKMATDGGAYPELAPFAGATRALTPIALLFLLAWPKCYARSRWRASTAMLVLRLAIASTFIAHGIEAFRLNSEFTDLIIVSADQLIGAQMEQATAEWLLRLIGVVDIAIAVAVVGTCPCLTAKPSWLKWGWRSIVGAGAGIAVYQLEQFREPATFVAHLAEQGTYWFGIEITTTFLINTAAVVVGVIVAWAVPHWAAITLYMAAWGLITAISRVVVKQWDGIDEALWRFAHCGAPLAMCVYWALNQKRRKSVDGTAPPVTR